MPSTDITEKFDLFAFLSRHKALLAALIRLLSFLLPFLPGDLPYKPHFYSFLSFLLLESNKLSRAKFEKPCLFFFLEVVYLLFLTEPEPTTWKVLAFSRYSPSWPLMVEYTPNLAFFLFFFLCPLVDRSLSIYYVLIISFILLSCFGLAWLTLLLCLAG